MTLHQSIVKKIQSGWTDDRLRQEYHWIHEQNLQAVIDGAKAVLKVKA